MLPKAPISERGLFSLAGVNDCNIVGQGQERVRKGHFPGGNVPYGFYRNKKKLFQHTHEVGAVRTVLNLADRGKLNPEIVSILNRRGYKRRNGKPWTRRQVQAILARRELYEQGKIRYGDVEGVDEKLILTGHKEQSEKEESRLGVAL